MRNITNKYEPIKLEKKYATTVATKLIVTVKANSNSHYLKTSLHWELEQVLFRMNTATINHYVNCSAPICRKITIYWCALLWSCYWKNVDDSTSKVFLGLLEKDRVYSFLLLAFFVNISTPSFFKDDRNS